MINFINLTKIQGARSFLQLAENLYKIFVQRVLSEKVEKETGLLVAPQQVLTHKTA